MCVCLCATEVGWSGSRIRLVAHDLREQQLKQTQLGEAAEESKLHALYNLTFRKALTLEMYRALTAMYCDTLQYIIGIVITNTPGALIMHLLILCQNSNSQTNHTLGLISYYRSPLGQFH